MKLESGPAAYDRNYFLAFLALCVFMGAYFMYDYKIGYPHKNLEAARKALTPIVGIENLPESLPEKPDLPEIKVLSETKPSELSAIHEILGPPFHIKPNSNGAEDQYFVSAYGMARLPVVRGRVDLAKIEWLKWAKSKDEIQLQFYCGLAAFAVGLYALSRVIRAATLKVVIDDTKMIYAKRHIPIDSMLRLCDYSPKGWVDLYYKHGLESRKLRIDNQKVRKFDEIINTICQLKGFEDPRKAVQEDQPDSTPIASETPEQAETGSDVEGEK